MRDRKISTFPAKCPLKDRSCSNGARRKLSFRVKLYLAIQAFLSSNKTWEVSALEATLYRTSRKQPFHTTWGSDLKKHPNAVVSGQGECADGRVPRTRGGCGRRWQQFSRWRNAPAETGASQNTEDTGFKTPQKKVIAPNSPCLLLQKGKTH